MFQGCIGDPLFVDNKLVGVLHKPESSRGFLRKYVNLLFGPPKNNDGTKGYTYRINLEHPGLVGTYFRTQ